MTSPLAGKRIAVLDLETLRSASDCRVCFTGQVQHPPPGTGICPGYQAIGWDDHALLGLSIGCYYDYRDSTTYWFDTTTVHNTIFSLTMTNYLLVSFNGLTFDFPVMRTVAAAQNVNGSTGLYEDFTALCTRSYDILDKIWQVDSNNKFGRGLNGLDAIAQANGLPAKAMDGTQAPTLWRQGRYAEALNYCAADVMKTRWLFEHIVEGKPFLRGDGQPITLPAPALDAYA